MTNQLLKYKLLSELIISWLTIAGTLIGGGAALYQFIENSHAERAKETLKFVERFEKDRVTNAIKDIDHFLNNSSLELEGRVNKSKDDLALYLKNKVNSEPLDIEIIFDIYDQLHACVLAKLCDEDIAVRFFGKYAYDLVGNFHPYIELYRKTSGDNSYGKGIKYFFNQHQKLIEPKPKLGLSPK